MKSIIFTFLLSVLIVHPTLSQVPTRSGLWKFDDSSNLTKADIGNTLQLVGTHSAIAGPAAGNGAIRISTGSHYRLQHNIAPNGGGIRVNNFSIQFDFKVSNTSSWKTFYQSNPNNDDDGECFINTSGKIGVGATGYSSYSITANEWYRLVISVKNGTHYKYYLDGQLLHDGTVQSVDSRFSLDNIVLLFGDNDGDDDEIDCAEIAIWDKALSAVQIKSLGGFNHQLPAGALQPTALWKFDDTSSLLESYYGSDLELVGTHQSVNGPSATNKAVRVGLGSYYKANTGFSANGGGTKVNEYSLKFDFKLKDITSWRTFFQTTAANNDDGECFINTSGKIGVGATGYGAYQLIPNEWYRLIITVKNSTHYKYYLDGKLLLNGTKQSVDGRFSFLDPLLLLADNDGDDEEIDIAEIAIWNRSLEESEVSQLSGFGHDITGGGGTQTKALVGRWKFDNMANPLVAEPNLGNNLELVGTHTAIPGPSTGNNAVSIGVGSHYKMTHGILPNGGGLKVNEFSIQIDFRVPSIEQWHCFFQLTPQNNNDGDCFINTGGYIGLQATGYSSFAIKPNEWYRLVISVQNGTQYKYYLDGQLLHNGTIQTIDGRLSLENVVLLFADEDGEDNEISCSEVAIWNYALSASEVSTLGGFGHYIGIPPTRQVILIPYLQAPTSNSMYVCWHDTMSTTTKVEYGITDFLGQSATGTSEIVNGAYRWHSVKLTGLQPNTEYFYRAVSGSGSSQIFSFRTLPTKNYTGKIRFLLLSDTHSSDTSWAVKVIKEAKKKIQQLYGNDIQNHVNFVLHSGDLVVSGSTIIQWTDQYFAPMSPISPNIPFMTVTGNHEVEHENYYKYMKYDEFSDYPTVQSLNERFWSFTTGSLMVIGLNSNITTNLGDIQKNWLEEKLNAAQFDPSIEFVFIIVHHFPTTELWVEGITYDGGPAYIANKIVPILKRFPKVIQLSYGHTHGFERGTIESMIENGWGDFRIVCGGGSGGATDRWGAFRNQDVPNIHITLDNYFYQLIEIDVYNRILESKMYSLGNSSKARNNEVLDSWYKKLNQPEPVRPTLKAPTFAIGKMVLNSSEIGSGDSLMTVRVQISQEAAFVKSVIDTMIHWKNIYGVDALYNPINKNAGLDLKKLSFPISKFVPNKTHYYRVKYRDHNLRWSVWSTAFPFNTPTDVDDLQLPTEFALFQNYPNPFNPATTINYHIPKTSHVSLKVYDILGKEVAVLVNEVKLPGKYQINFDSNSISKIKLASGVYIYRMIAEGFSFTKKLVVMK